MRSSCAKACVVTRTFAHELPSSRSSASRNLPGIQGIIPVDDRYIDVDAGARQLRRGDVNEP